jgi:hypothetical protein
MARNNASVVACDPELPPLENDQRQKHRKGSQRFSAVDLPLRNPTCIAVAVGISHEEKNDDQARSLVSLRMRSSHGMVV